MAQDAPSDTAGPSSPPPRLPDGWLPQWEGVQRKWYYVQRATGKSQWDIPTEPVVLTPSTTPTSIGTGPSQAPPSRQSTHSPRGFPTGNTLVERMESVADSAKLSSAIGSHLNGLPENPTQSSLGTQGWQLNQISLHDGLPHPQQFGSSRGGYASNSFPQRSFPTMGHGGSAIYTGPEQPHHPLNSQHMVQDPSQPIWGNAAGVRHPYPSKLIADHRMGPYTNESFILGSQQPQNYTPYTSSLHSLDNQPSGPSVGFPTPQRQWQTEQVHTNLSHSSKISPPQFGSSDSSRPLFSSYPTPQTMIQPPGELASRSVQSHNNTSATAGFGAGHEALHTTHGAFSHDSRIDTTGHSHTLGPQPLSRSLSHQNANFQQQGAPPGENMIHSSFHGYPMQASASLQAQYQNHEMARTRSGPGFNQMAFPMVTGAQSSTQYYQDLPVQAGAAQYLASQHQNQDLGLDGSLGHPGVRYQYPTARPDGHSSHWVNPNPPQGSRIASSDSQFVSGPWASTPPTHGVPEPRLYE